MACMATHVDDGAVPETATSLSEPLSEPFEIVIVAVSKRPGTTQSPVLYTNVYHSRPIFYCIIL